MDVMMPRLDGLETTRALRSAGNDVPIIVLTARDAVGDRVDGLDAGADDYLTKPFALQELLARLRALLRRAVPLADDEEEVLSFGGLTMNLATREVTRDGRAIELTRTEFTLLEMFLRRPRRVLDRAFILEEVWGYDFPTTANSLEVYVGYLRRKTEAAGRVAADPHGARRRLRAQGVMTTPLNTAVADEAETDTEIDRSGWHYRRSLASRVILLTTIAVGLAVPAGVDRRLRHGAQAAAGQPGPPADRPCPLGRALRLPGAGGRPSTSPRRPWARPTSGSCCCAPTCSASPSTTSRSPS